MQPVPTDPATKVHLPSRIDNAACYHYRNSMFRCVSWMYGTEGTLEEAEKRGLRPCRRCYRGK